MRAWVGHLFSSRWRRNLRPVPRQRIPVYATAAKMAEEARLRAQVSILQRKLETQARQHEYDEDDRLQVQAQKDREHAAELVQAGEPLNLRQPCLVPTQWG